MAPILFEIGPFALESIWIATTLGLLWGTLLFIRNAKYKRMNIDFLLHHTASLLIGTIIGARLLFYLENWGYFGPFKISSLFKHIVFFWQPGYGFWGGVLGFALVFGWHAHREKEDLMKWLDAFMVPFFSGIIIGNMGQLLGGEGYGRETILPWGITYESTNVKYTVPVHPTQIYSILLISGILLNKERLMKKFNWLSEEGNENIAMLFLYSFGRFLIEFARGDDTLLIAGIRIGQIVAFLATVAFGVMLAKRRKKALHNK